jgi:hypothetical protein
MSCVLLPLIVSEFSEQILIQGNGDSMKTRVVVFFASAFLALSTLSNSANANSLHGFRCLNHKFHVKVYNEVAGGASQMPEVLLVSILGEGTVLRLDKSEIKTTGSDNDIEYSGEGNLISNGHFASIKLSVENEVIFDEKGPAEHKATLAFVSDGVTSTSIISCFEYQR